MNLRIPKTVKQKLQEKQQLKESGYAGILDGKLVDRREHPEAKLIKEESFLKIKS